MLAPESVWVPDPFLTNASTVVGLLVPEFWIAPLNTPLPLSLPIDKVSALPAPPSAKSIFPLPVIVPTFKTAFALP